MTKNKNIIIKIAKTRYLLIKKIVFSIIKNIYIEWKIWSQCLGKVIVLNGTSSSGKTSLSSYIKRLGFNVINADSVEEEILIEHINILLPQQIEKLKNYISYSDLLKILSGFAINNHKYNQYIMQLIHQFQTQLHIIRNNIKPITIRMICERIYEQARRHIFAGRNVVIDIVADGEILNVKELSYCFRYYPLTVILLYSTISENLLRCFKRNYNSYKNDEENFRYPSNVINQYIKFYHLRISTDLSKRKPIIEKIDDIYLRKILDYAIFCEEELLEYNQNRTLFKNGKQDDTIKPIINYISKLKTILKLHPELFVQTAVECDYILYNYELKAVHKEAHEPQHSWITPFFNNYKKTIRSERIDFVPVMNGELQPRSLLYFNDERLPTILGDRGDIQTLEYADGVVKPLRMVFI